MLHPMGRQPQAAPRAVVLRASQRHIDVLGLSADLMRYMAHANFLLRSLALTIRSEGHYTDYAFTVIRAVLLTDVAAPESLRLNVDSTDLLYKVAESRTLRVVSAGAPEPGCADGADEVAFSKPSVRELTLRFGEIGKLGIPFAARHFPRLERLVLNAHADVGHPALENTLYGCLFLEPWARLRRVQLAHINDTLVQLLASSCPALAELIVFNAATHAELMAKHSFDIHRTLIPLPSMPSMRFTPKSLHYLLTRFAHLRVLDLNYPLYVDPLTRAHDIDASLAASLARATAAAAQQQPRQLRYLSLPFIPLTAHGIGGILGAFPRLMTLEVRLAVTPSGASRPASMSASALASRRRRQQLLARVRDAVSGKESAAAAAAAGVGAGVAELSALWVWSDWASAATTLAQVLGLFTQAGRRVPRVYVPYVAGVEAASEVETRLIMQHMRKEMPWATAHRFEYNVADYYT
ncbi:hypothetical protein GGF37_005029 [Kickxella alabastrina]|nr:hypothetical protein GGF37_005029 [Kickxella alabastrina]